MHRNFIPSRTKLLFTVLCGSRVFYLTLSTIVYTSGSRTVEAESLRENSEEHISALKELEEGQCDRLLVPSII